MFDAEQGTTWNVRHSVPSMRRADRRASVFSFYQQNLFGVIQFAQLHLDNLAICGLHFAPDERRLDGQFAMAAVDQDAKLHLLRTTFIEKSVQGGTRGAPGVKDIIHQNDLFSGDTNANFGFLYNRLWTDSGKIVTVERNVQGAQRDRFLLNSFDHLAEALGKENAATANADDRQVLGAIIFLDDFVNQPDQSTLDF